MQRVSGLQHALTQYDSSKVKERAQGAAALREIFSNRENLEVFQETAARDGGAGWIAFFQCLFQVAVNEKKAYLKPNSTATSEYAPRCRTSLFWRKLSVVPRCELPCSGLPALSCL